MPLLRQWSPVPQNLAATWQVDEHTENELFFSSWRTGVDAARDAQEDLPNLPRRRLEFLAGRYLLWHLENNFPLHQIARDEHGKPRLPEDEFHFSISHSFPYIAVLISPDKRCGIDIQRWHPRISVLADKFLREREKELFGGDEKLLTMAWCIKEAAYKWQGKRGVDFIRDINIQSITEKEGIYEVPTIILPDIAITPLNIQASIADGYALALVCE